MNGGDADRGTEAQGWGLEEKKRYQARSQERWPSGLSVHSLEESEPMGTLGPVAPPAPCGITLSFSTSGNLSPASEPPHK